jgi:hypothetical protein
MSAKKLEQTQITICDERLPEMHKNYPISDSKERSKKLHTFTKFQMKAILLFHQVKQFRLIPPMVIEYYSSRFLLSQAKHIYCQGLRTQLWNLID